MPLNVERISDVFVTLCQIDSPSRQEKAIFDYLSNLFRKEFSARILEDDSASKTGANCGNLFVRIGNPKAKPPLFFNCHLDTVEPACGVVVRREGERFFSAGNTILGADDKAGIAMLIELAFILKEESQALGQEMPPLEFVFTTCEEIGLLGAKHLDYSLIQAPYGFSLDTCGIDLAVTAAPAAVHFTITAQGLAAHAGFEPQNGINAILLAAKALARLKIGRIDHETTANIGIVSGGTATNIVPEQVRLEGEARSHCPEKLAEQVRLIKTAFNQTISEYHAPDKSDNKWEGAPCEQDKHAIKANLPSVEFHFAESFPQMTLAPESAPMLVLHKASEQLSRPLQYISAGGGSDANIFNGHGFPTAIIGTGMTDVHSTNESITLNSLVRTTQLIEAIYKAAT